RFECLYVLTLAGFTFTLTSITSVAALQHHLFAKLFIKPDQLYHQGAEIHLSTVTSTCSPELQQLVLKPSVVPGEPKQRKIFVIYTGGTNGMKQQESGVEPEPGALVPFLRKQPSLH
uniref:Uncharacterized protein n=1 Tax=Callorhinchus milii TaxID=7868 RepID=A0A4W3IQK3_CALMI